MEFAYTVVGIAIGIIICVIIVLASGGTVCYL